MKNIIAILEDWFFFYFTFFKTKQFQYMIQKVPSVIFTSQKLKIYIHRKTLMQMSTEALSMMIKTLR